MKFTKERFPLIFTYMNGNNNDALNTKRSCQTYILKIIVSFAYFRG